MKSQQWLRIQSSCCSWHFFFLIGDRPRKFVGVQISRVTDEGSNSSVAAATEPSTLLRGAIGTAEPRRDLVRVLLGGVLPDKMAPVEEALLATMRKPLL